MLVLQLVDAVAELLVEVGEFAARGAQGPVLAGGVAVPARFAGLLDEVRDLPQGLVQLAAGHRAARVPVSVAAPGWVWRCRMVSRT